MAGIESTAQTMVRRLDHHQDRQQSGGVAPAVAEKEM
jgi:hypothetical protein